MPAGYLKKISNMKFSPASRGRYLTIDVVPAGMSYRQSPLFVSQDSMGRW